MGRGEGDERFSGIAPLLRAPMLEGETVDTGAEVRRLKDQIEQLESDLAVAKAEAARVKAQCDRALRNLRHQLSPLHMALKDVFGELDASGVTDDAPAETGGAQFQGGPTPGQDSRVAKVWESWKQKLGEGPAKVIDALLMHGEMNTQQLAIVTGYHRTTVPGFIYKLNKAGLLNKSGGKFSLKQL
jgi:hypothetical protein